MEREECVGGVVEALPPEKAGPVSEDEVAGVQQLELVGATAEARVGPPNRRVVEVEEHQAAIFLKRELGAVAIDRLVSVGRPGSGSVGLAGAGGEPHSEAVGVGAHLEKPSRESLVRGDQEVGVVFYMEGGSSSQHGAGRGTWCM